MTSTNIILNDLVSEELGIVRDLNALEIDNVVGGIRPERPDRPDRPARPGIQPNEREARLSRLPRVPLA